MILVEYKGAKTQGLTTNSQVGPDLLNKKADW